MPSGLPYRPEHPPALCYLWPLPRKLLHLPLLGHVGSYPKIDNHKNRGTKHCGTENACVSSCQYRQGHVDVDFMAVMGADEIGFLEDGVIRNTILFEACQILVDLILFVGRVEEDQDTRSHPGSIEDDKWRYAAITQRWA